MVPCMYITLRPMSSMSRRSSSLICMGLSWPKRRHLRRRSAGYTVAGHRLHTGSVGFTVDIFDAPSPLDESWEEIVEVLFVLLPTAESIVLMEWAGEGSYPLSLEPGTYRVRYSARGMDKGHEADTSPRDGTVIDHYNLAFWPAEAAEDRIIKQTSQNAIHWHNFAQGLA